MKNVHSKKFHRIGQLLLLTGLLAICFSACGPSPEEIAASTATAQTAIAAGWTKTPTATPSNTPTNTPTLTPIPTETPTPTPEPSNFGGSESGKLVYMIEQYGSNTAFVADFSEGTLGEPQKIPGDPKAFVYLDINWDSSTESLFTASSNKIVYQSFLDVGQPGQYYNVSVDAPKSISVNPVTGEVAMSVISFSDTTRMCSTAPFPPDCITADKKLMDPKNLEKHCNTGLGFYDRPILLYCYSLETICIAKTDHCEALTDSTVMAASNPSWSPDGEKIAYMSTFEGTSAIYIMDADGSNSKRVTTEPGASHSSITWSPDGSKLLFAYQSLAEDTTREICMIGTDGTGYTCLTDDLVIDDTPAWSPNGKMVMYASLKGKYMHLFLKNLEDQSLTQVTSDDDKVNHLHPIWLP